MTLVLLVLHEKMNDISKSNILMLFEFVQSISITVFDDPDTTRNKKVIQNILVKLGFLVCIEEM